MYGVAHDAKEISALCFERNTAEHFDCGVRIGEMDLIEFDRSDALLEFNRPFIICDGGL